jgi:hypothetical protein
MTDKLIAFAKRRALISGIVAGVLNVIILYFALSGKSQVPLFALVADKWNHSLIGALVPRALVISIVITFTTVWITLKAHSQGGIHNIPWVRITLIKALIRSVLAFIFVLALALLLRATYPTYAEISTSIVIPVVAVFAGVVASYMTYSTVLSTESLLHPEE